MKNRSSPKLEAALEEASVQLNRAEEQCRQLRIKRNAIAIALQAIDPGDPGDVPFDQEDVGDERIDPGDASSESHDTEPTD